MVPDLFTPLNSQWYLGIPVITDNTITTVLVIQNTFGQIIQGAINATRYRKASIQTRTLPGIGIKTFFLSPGVENIAGNEINTSEKITAPTVDSIPTAHGPEIQDTTSTEKRSDALISVSFG